jgi:cytidyltransferase-like protein
VRTVLANGCFDLLHYGHLLHLEAAAALGDRLVVAITRDAVVAKEKGRDHPVYPDWQRARLVGALSLVAETILVDGTMEALERVNPDVLAKGIDYRDSMQPSHVAYCQERGIEVVITNTPKFSSSEMIDAARRRS